MIHSIAANQPTFRPVKLTPGLNVILADRTKGSSRKDTRNGLGKSTLIEIIHFCLGAKDAQWPGAGDPGPGELGVHDGNVSRLRPDYHHSGARSHQTP